MEKINIAELLKDCLRGMELDCSIYENVTLVQVKEGYDYPIVIETPNGQMLLSKYGCFSKNELAKCVIFPKGKTTWDGFHRPFKDGDVVFYDNCVSIFKEWGDATLFRNYVKADISGGQLTLCARTSSFGKGIKRAARFATEEEKQKLFDAIKANGYKWNTETKTLEKLVEPRFKVGDRVRNKNYKDYIYTIHDIVDKGYRAKEIDADSPIIILFGSQEDNYELVPNKFDINTLKPFESRVLVRDKNTEKWKSNFWGFYDIDNAMNYPYECCGCSFSQCIPYEGNEHLLGNTDDCDDFYKTW